MRERSSAKWFVAAMVLTVVSVSFAVWLRRHKTESLEAFASANGRLEATEYEIRMRRASRIVRLRVQEGDTVEAGQIVAEMESPDRRQEELQAEAELTRAREELNQAKLIVPQKKRDLEEVGASLSQRERELLFAQGEFEKSRELLAKDLIARQELSELEAKLRIAEATLTLDQARKQAAEAALKAAAFQVKQKHAAVDEAQARVKETRPQTEDRFLRAPLRGFVLARFAEPGAVVDAGSRVLTLLELKDIFMVISLPGAQAERVSLGSEARVVLDAAPHPVLPGVVAFISAQSPFRDNEAKGPREGESPRFRVKVEIDAARLKPHLQKVEAGLTGVAYVRLDAAMDWPETLQVK